MATQLKAVEAPEDWLNTRLLRGMTDQFAEVATVTPELARVLLTRNDDNRPISAGRVAAYADDMRAGRWATNGEAIVISREGRLNDGQHRLAAIVAANESIRSMVAFGIAHETRLTTNQGKAKGAGDYLGMMGHKNPNVIAGAARNIIAYQATGHILTKRATNAEVLDFVAANTDELEAAAALARTLEIKLRMYIGGTPATFCIYMFNRINAGLARQYFTSIANGESLSAGDPALTIRDRLLALGKSNQSVKVELAFRGWNALREGRRLDRAQVHGVLPRLV